MIRIPKCEGKHTNITEEEKSRTSRNDGVRAYIEARRIWLHFGIIANSLNLDIGVLPTDLYIYMVPPT